MENTLKQSLKFASEQDQLFVLDFICQTAALLKAKDYLDEFDVEAIKKSFKDYLKTDASSFTLLLAKENQELFSLIHSILGERFLMVNLFHLSARPILSRLMQSLKASGQELLSIAHLKLNKHFYCNSINHHNTDLFASLLLEFGTQLQTTLVELTTVCSPMQKIWHKTKIYDNDLSSPFIEQLGKTLDWQGTESFTHLPFAEQNMMMDIKNCFGKLVYAGREINLLCQSQESKSFDLAEHYLKEILKLSEHLSLLQLSKIASIEASEKQRIQALKTIILLEHNFLNFWQTLAPVLKSFQGSSPENRLGQDSTKELTLSLLKKGHHLTHVGEAIQQLSEYCLQQKVKPWDLLPGELYKMNSLFNDDNELMLKNNNPEQIVKQKNSEKSKYLAKAKILETLFSSSTTLAVLIMTFFTGCGIRGPLRSEILDFRPPIPYHEDRIGSFEAEIESQKQITPLEKSDEKQQKNLPGNLDRNHHSL